MDTWFATERTVASVVAHEKSARQATGAHSSAYARPLCARLLGGRGFSSDLPAVSATRPLLPQAVAEAAWPQRPALGLMREVGPRALTYDLLIARYGNKNPVHAIENKRRRPSLIANFRESRILRPEPKSNFSYDTPPPVTIAAAAIKSAAFPLLPLPPMPQAFLIDTDRGVRVTVVSAARGCHSRPEPAKLLDTPCRANFKLSR
jgi:hypothetical protein